MERVKILVHEDGENAKNPKWHLVEQRSGTYETFCQGEVFGYGQSAAEYIREQLKKGGITCPNCITRIKWVKSIKL